MYINGVKLVGMVPEAAFALEINTPLAEVLNQIAYVLWVPVTAAAGTSTLPPEKLIAVSVEPATAPVWFNVYAPCSVPLLAFELESVAVVPVVVPSRQKARGAIELVEVTLRSWLSGS